MNYKRYLGSLVLLLSLTWAFSATAQPGPRETVEAANQQLSALLKQKAPTTPQATKAHDTKLREIVTNLLDLDHMAQESLGRYWSQQTEEERREYVTLMKQLVERSYLKQARSRTSYTVSFGAVNVNGNEAEVETTLRVTSRGRREAVEVVYSMALREGRWRVVDVETDGASTVRNYRAQFRRIIQNEGFAELVARMRRRLAAGEADL